MITEQTLALHNACQIPLFNATFPQGCELTEENLDIAKRAGLDTRWACQTLKYTGHHNNRWYLNGQYHRVDGPAIIYGGCQAWYQNGKLHRIDGPAITAGAYQEWFLNGKRHRTDGPAYINGDRQAWFLNGLCHRVDGPAVVAGACQFWYLNGKQVDKP